MTSFDQVFEERILGRSFVEYREYYAASRTRYRKTAALVGSLGLPAGSRHLDIGGGQMALITAGMFGFAPAVGDAVDRAAGDIRAQGVAFERLNLMDAEIATEARYDLVTLLEVIEHLPVPPYVVLTKLRQVLRPGGWLVMTTPNGFRIRNILRMLANREVLDIYRYPRGDEVLGHQHEYTLRQMEWQLKEAGYAVEVLRTYASGWTGASAAARLAHLATLPATAFPHLRDGLMLAARAPAEAAG